MRKNRQESLGADLLGGSVQGGCKLHLPRASNTHSCEEGVAAALTHFPKGCIMQKSSCVSWDYLPTKYQGFFFKETICVILERC